MFQSGKDVWTMSNLFQTAECRNVGERGVLYVHILRAESLPLQDDLAGNDKGQCSRLVLDSDV